MSGQASTNRTPIENKQQLVDYIAAGEKPPASWRLGTEHEKFGFTWRDKKPLAYEGERGIRAVLEGLTRFGWEQVKENDKLIALRQGRQSVTLEPGGQLELSGAPLEDVHETCDEVHTHLAQVKEVSNELDIGFLGIGCHPSEKLADIPVMPKGRYDIMTRYMPKKGNLGHEMMYRTCTIQVNLDYGSEADMVRKFRVGLALQPLATAMFANSPITEGKPNGFMSYRAHVWSDTDPDRTGMLPFVFEDKFGYESWVDYVLDVPMYFVYRDGSYIDAAGQSFRDFMAGKLPALPGETPIISDWEDHLTTIFPEVRLKQFLEMRGADGGPWRRICGLPALWAGIMYDETALAAAWDLVGDWTAQERDYLRLAVPKTALATPFRGKTVRDLAAEMLEIATAGLKTRARHDSSGNDETGFLGELREIVDSGRPPAQELLERYENEWHGDITPVFEEYAF